MRIRYLLYPLKHRIQQLIFSYKWRCHNSHNETTAENIFPAEIVKVGLHSYGELRILSYHSPNEGLVIGNYCSIANDVLFILGGEHNYKCFSNYPFYRKLFHEGIDAISKGPIIVEDDVWIGARCTILSGVKLGKGCVIGAGSVVSKNVPPYAVYVNGEILKYRFPKEVLDKLREKIDFSALSEEKLYQNKDLLHKEVNESNVDGIIDQILGN